MKVLLCAKFIYFLLFSLPFEGVFIFGEKYFILYKVLFYVVHFHLCFRFALIATAYQNQNQYFHASSALTGRHYYIFRKTCVWRSVRKIWDEIQQITVFEVSVRYICLIIICFKSVAKSDELKQTVSPVFSRFSKKNICFWKTLC